MTDIRIIGHNEELPLDEAIGIYSEAATTYLVKAGAHDRDFFKNDPLVALEHLSIVTQVFCKHKGGFPVSGQFATNKLNSYTFQQAIIQLNEWWPDEHWQFPLEEMRAIWLVTFGFLVRPMIIDFPAAADTIKEPHPLIAAKKVSHGEDKKIIITDKD